MRHILITGTNRGIGLELARQYVQIPDIHILCAARPFSGVKAAALSKLTQENNNRFTLILLDVTDSNLIQDAVEQLSRYAPKIDILIHNAGVNPNKAQDIETISADTMRHVFEVNTLAPMMLTQAFLPLLRKSEGAKIIYISSDMASLAGRTYGGSNAYCISKAGLNMLARGAAAEFKSEGMIAVALDPGWVKTDMGGPHATLTPDESARGIIRVVDGLTMQDSGQFWRWDGQHNEW